MPIPSFDKLLRPVLNLASEGPITRSIATEAMTRLHRLSEEERTQKLPSGSGSTIANRTGWAMTFLTKAGLIQKIAPKTYEATPNSRAFLARFPEHIKTSDLEDIPGYQEAWDAGRAKRQVRSKAEPAGLSDEASRETPQEIIGRELEALHADFRGRLLQTVLSQTPEFFEQLVLDVLIAMGYGGSREEAAQRLGRTGDEGIDGRINQDALGLDQIMVQAKRYNPEATIGRKTIQEFIGSLSGQGVTKGIFITTSSFTGTADEFVLRGASTKVVLVDGAMLIDLMIKHSIGVRVAHTYKVQEIDQNYFDEVE